MHGFMIFSTQIGTHNLLSALCFGYLFIYILVICTIHMHIAHYGWMLVYWLYGTVLVLLQYIISITNNIHKY